MSRPICSLCRRTGKLCQYPTMRKPVISPASARSPGKRRRLSAGLCESRDTRVHLLNLTQILAMAHPTSPAIAFMLLLPHMTTRTLTKLRRLVCGLTQTRLLTVSLVQARICLKMLATWTSMPLPYYLTSCVATS
jgi:hypothetical protein